MPKVERNSTISSLAVGGLTGGIEAAIIHPVTTLRVQYQQKPGQTLKKIWKEYTYQNVVKLYDGTTNIRYHPIKQLSGNAFHFTKFLYRGLGVHVQGMTIVMAIRVAIYDNILKHGFTNQKPSFFQNAVSGACTGLLTSPWMSAMELAMTFKQTASPNVKIDSVFETYKKIIKTRGVKKAFTGLACVAGRDVPVVTSFLTFVPQFKRYLATKHGMKDNIISSLAVGGAVGATCVIATQPLDTLKAIQQIRLRDSIDPKDSTIVGAFKHLIKEEGFKGLYRGLFWRLARITPHVALLSEISNKLTEVVGGTKKVSR